VLILSWGSASIDSMFEPDPELAALLAADDAARAEPPEEQPPAWVLASLPATELDQQQLFDRLVALDRQLARLAAEQLRVLAAIHQSDDSTPGWSQDAVSLALQLSGAAAQKKLKIAATLTSDLPRTLAALSHGDIPARHAELITEASWRVPADVSTDFETLVLARAAQQTPGELATSIRRATIALDPATAEQRRQTALADRALTRQTLPDGMAELRLTHTADAIQAAYQRIDAAARLLPTSDERTRDQQRADLAIDAILAGIPADGLPELQGRKPSIQVVVAATTLLGLDDQPADLAGHGPITAQHARELAAAQDGTWRRLLTDPNTGHLLDAGTQTYRPSQHLVDFRTARDGECVFPTCHQPAHLCEIEHCPPFDAGGPTAPHNNAITRKRHNTCKKPDAPFSYTINPDGSTTWTHKPTGRTYHNQPRQRWPQPPPPTPSQPAPYPDDPPF
jgi:hypothetical protein